MMRDSQRTAVYRWEDEVRKRWPSTKMSLDECKALVERVWNDYCPDHTPPEVTDGRGRRRACGGRWVIKLPVFARNRIVVLHETAHSLLEGEKHGPKFARLLLNLWARYAKVPVREARSMAVHQKPRRVRFSKTEDVPKPVSQKYRQWQAELRRLRLALEKHYLQKPPKHK